MVPLRSSLLGAATTATLINRGLHTATTTTTAATTAECAPSKPQQQAPRLLKLVVVFRHGARTPVFTNIPGLGDVAWPVCSREKAAALPSCVVTDHASPGRTGPRPPLASGVAKQVNFTLPGDCYAGQLSDLGIDQTAALGRMLRQEYGAFLPHDPAAGGHLTVRSTNVPRCVASAQGVLSGLYPLHDSKAAPFQITTLHGDDEYLAPNTKKCRRLAELWGAARIAWGTDAAAGAVPDARGEFNS